MRWQLTAVLGIGGMLVVGIVTMMSGSENPWRLAFGCLAALGLFAVMGFVLGTLLVAFSPLAEAVEHLEEGRNEGRASVRVPVGIAVEDLEPGMKVTEAVIDPKGQQVARRDTVLTENEIDAMRNLGIEKIFIEGISYLED